MQRQAQIGAEAVWRKALQSRGREWVAAELKRLPGRPRDPVLDVVFEEPYPTREFCQLWCAEEESRFHPVSWTTLTAGAVLLIAVYCLIMAVSSWNELEATQAATAPQVGASPPAVTQSTPPTNDIPVLPDFSTAPSSTTSLPSECAYYQSTAAAECSASN